MPRVWDSFGVNLHNRQVSMDLKDLILTVTEFFTDPWIVPLASWTMFEIVSGFFQLAVISFFALMVLAILNSD